MGRKSSGSKSVTELLFGSLMTIVIAVIAIIVLISTGIIGWKTVADIRALTSGDASDPMTKIVGVVTFIGIICLLFGFVGLLTGKAKSGISYFILGMILILFAAFGGSIISTVMGLLRGGDTHGYIVVHFSDNTSEVFPPGAVTQLFITNSGKNVTSIDFYVTWMGEVDVDKFEVEVFHPLRMMPDKTYWNEEIEVFGTEKKKSIKIGTLEGDELEEVMYNILRDQMPATVYYRPSAYTKSQVEKWLAEQGGYEIKFKVRFIGHKLDKTMGQWDWKEVWKQEHVSGICKFKLMSGSRTAPIVIVLVDWSWGTINSHIPAQSFGFSSSGSFSLFTVLVILNFFISLLFGIIAISKRGPPKPKKVRVRTKVVEY